MAELTDEGLKVLADAMNRQTEIAFASQDGGRVAAAKDAQVEIAKAMTEATAPRPDPEIAALRAELADMKAALTGIRQPSIAAQVGNPPIEQPSSLAESLKGAHFAVEPYMKASLGMAYVPGQFISALMDLKGNPDEFARGKAAIERLGVGWNDPQKEAKATLGTTGATGGYVLPNNLVATLVKPNTQAAVYTGANPLVTVIPNVMVRGVDQPYRTGAPTRMTAQNWGAPKENLDEAYGSYTATLTTFARIYDIGRQYARFSAGSAEQDVLDELTKAQMLGENFSVIAGAGTGSATPGVNDATKGLYTSLLGNVYTTAHTASSSTVAGSVAAALATAFGTLGTRSRYPDAVVMDITSYWTMFSQGSDNAGFWMSQLLGAGFTLEGGQLRWNGVPIYHDANLGTNAATKIAITGEWKTLKFYRGLEFRVDSSEVAGDRWDKNLIGFRGEAEWGVNADTAVAVGAFQLITGLVP